MGTSKKRQGSKQPKTATNSKKLRTPRAQQVRVMVRSAMGESQRTIAQSEGLDRGTVNRILSQEQYQKIIICGRQRLARLIDNSLHHYEKQLKPNKKTDKLTLDTARHVLDGTQVAIPRTQSIVEHKIDPYANRSLEEQEFFFRTGWWPEEVEQMLGEQENGKGKANGSDSRKH